MIGFAAQIAETIETNDEGATMEGIAYYPNFVLRQQALRVRDMATNGTLRLFANDVMPGPATLVGDLVEATFSGYAAANIGNTQGSVFLDDSGAYAWLIPTKQFAHDGGPAANVIYGAYVLGEFFNLVGVSRFAQPVAMAQLGDALPLSLRFRVKRP